MNTCEQGSNYIFHLSKNQIMNPQLKFTPIHKIPTCSHISTHKHKIMPHT